MLANKVKCKKMLNHTFMFVYTNKGYNINVLTQKGFGIGLFVYKQEI